MEPSPIFNMEPLDEQEGALTPASTPQEDLSASWGYSLEPLDETKDEEGFRLPTLNEELSRQQPADPDVSMQTTSKTHPQPASPIENPDSESTSVSQKSAYDPLESDLDLTHWAAGRGATSPDVTGDKSDGLTDQLNSAEPVEGDPSDQNTTQELEQDFDLMPLESDLDMAPLMDDDAISKNAKNPDVVHIEEILREGVSRGSSDIHLSVNLPPAIRVDGRLVKLDYAPLEPEHIQRMLYDILTGEQIQWFEKQRELDMSYGVAGLGRFRVNVYRQRGSVGAAFRTVPSEIPSFDKLHLPPVVRELTHRHSGLILVTGPTGSGKSTTIASMIDFINTESAVHIMTIEDPIEYLHKHKKAMVNQRELNSDTDSFDNALRAVLREDPDVILVGEMRDLETISAAITLAETGHLVFGTLHTRSASQTIDRVVDVFPPHQQEQIRVQLANTLEGVISQLLLPMNGGGRIAAVEIMVATSGIRNLIREGKSFQLPTALETGQQLGMVPMDKSLAQLYLQGLVSLEEARVRALDAENFDRYLKGQ